MFITSSTRFLTIKNSHGLCPPYTFVISFKTFSLHQYHYLITILWDTEQIIGNLKYVSLKDNIFQVTQIQVTMF